MPCSCRVCLPALLLAALLAAADGRRLVQSRGLMPLSRTPRDQILRVEAYRRRSAKDQAVITTAYMAPARCGAGAAARGFYGFVESSEFVPFMRAAVATIEGAPRGGLGLWHYRIRIIPVSARRGVRAFARSFPHRLKPKSATARQAEACGFVLTVEGDSRLTHEPPEAPGLSSDDLDTPISYTNKTGRTISPGVSQKDLLVAWGDFTRCFRDAQGRAMYVVVLRRFVRRMTELSDDELSELWSVGAKPAERIGFDLISVNFGGFQNVAHLHLKFWLKEIAYNKYWAGDAVYQKLHAFRQSGGAEVGN